MPNYSYACTECGHAFDIYQAFSDDALTTCPQCQGVLRKKFSAVGVVFKGSGFYRNDARGSSSTTESGGSSSKGEATKDGGAKDSSSTSGGESGSKAKTADGASSASTNGTSSSGSGSGSGSAKKTPAKVGAST